MIYKKTKIICTLGPSSNSVSEITALIRNGMNLARLNFSHGNYQDHLKIIQNLKTAEQKSHATIGLIQDLQGPKIRVGEMPSNGIKVKKGETITLTTKSVIGSELAGKKTIPVQYKKFIQEVEENQLILIEDGLISLKSKQKDKDQLICQVIEGGIIKNHKGINVPNAHFSINCLTKKDLSDLEWGLEQNVDFVAISFVQSAKDINYVREIIQKAGKKTKIIAKIERPQALKNIEEIVKSTDAIMVARGDLGIEIPNYLVPIAQKEIIKVCKKHQKPVIVATQLLQSMIDHPVATRAEISDVFQAVQQDADCVMLSNESAVGKFAAKAVKTLSQTAAAAEQYFQNQTKFLSKELGMLTGKNDQKISSKTNSKSKLNNLLNKTIKL